MFHAIRNFLLRMADAGRSEADMSIVRFRANRQQLQDEFFRLASSSGKPRGLIWTNCDWQSEFALVKDSSTGLLTAYSAVHVSFAAVEGGEMEGVDAVSAIREGSAVFHYQNGQWGTGGGLLFNMSPKLAAQRVGDGHEVLRIVDLE
ncbi:MAG: hypothetical protein R3C19_17205 [Planctomycetaceae bacterium]